MIYKKNLVNLILCYQDNKFNTVRSFSKMRVCVFNTIHFSPPPKKILCFLFMDLWLRCDVINLCDVGFSRINNMMMGHMDQSKLTKKIIRKITLHYTLCFL